MLFPWKSALRLRKENCFYEPRQAGRWGFCVGKELVVLTRLCCGSLGRKCHPTCDRERQWKEAARCWLSPAWELQPVLPPCPLQPPGTQSLPGWAVPGIRPKERCPAGAEHCRALFPQPCLLAPPPACSHSLPHCGQGKVEILPGCFPSQALPFCLLNMYLSSLLPGVALLFSSYSCVILGVGHINKCTLVGNGSDLYNSWRVWSCCDVW